MTDSEYDWLDTETQACLERTPPLKLAPPTTDAFTVVVLRHMGSIGERGLLAFQAAFGISEETARALAGTRPPYVAQRRLTEADALLAQFELICCDIISVFVADSVVSGASPDYLAALYRSLLRGDELSAVRVTADSIPETEQGDRFCRQFFGRRPEFFPHRFEATFKKARLMQHWASAIGGWVTIEQRG